MKKIGELDMKDVTLIIKYDDRAKGNNYRVYIRHWWNNKYGCGIQKDEFIVSYADIHSVMVWLEDYVYRHNEESR